MYMCGLPCCATIERLHLQGLGTGRYLPLYGPRLHSSGLYFYTLGSLLRRYVHCSTMQQNLFSSKIDLYWIIDKKSF